MTAAATRLLLRSHRGLYTVPAAGLYPHQWSWDSAFIAIGLRHISPRRAQQELESLFSAQWADGRLPQIVFDPDAAGYSPGPDFWHSERIPGSPVVPTAGLVQPPNHAWATLLVHLADPEESRRRRFLERAYPVLCAWHGYLAEHRSSPAGLPVIVHPWESGMDNSPFWDEPLAAIPIDDSPVPRPDLDHAPHGERPTDGEYRRYLAIAAAYRDAGCDDSAASTPFRVEDPAVAAIAVRSERALAEIAELLAESGAAHLERAAVTAAAIETLWHPRVAAYVARDVHTDRLQPYRTVSGLLTLLVPGLRHADEVLQTLSGPAFGLGRSVLVPSADLSWDGVDAVRYWRGPSWFNTAWLMLAALREHGHPDAADRLAAELAARAEPSGFAEYLGAIDGEPHGTRGFSWTAALALDAQLARA